MNAGFNVGDTNQDGQLSPGETWQYTASYTLTQDDIDNGGIVNPTLAHHDDATATTNVTATSGSASVTIVQNPHIVVAKSADVASVDAAGDAINYTVTVTNDGNMTLTGLTVSDPFVTNLAYASGDTDNDGKLDLGETWTYTGSHTVTQAEIDNGGVVDPNLHINNTATADTAQTDPQTASASVAVEQHPHLIETKTAVLHDGGAAVDNAGDVIDYTVTLANDGNMTLTGVTLSDPYVSLTLASGDSNNNGKLDLGETWTYTGSHTVTQAEIDNGGVVDPNLHINNTATADTAQTDPQTASASVAVVQNPDLDITKAADVASVDAAGDVINYTVTVDNAGNMTLTGITVSDPFVTNLAYASGDTNNDGKLDVTETWTYTGSHTVTQAEIDNGANIDNTATADIAYASGDTNNDGKLDVTETWTYTGSHTVTQGEMDNGGTIDNTATADSDQTSPESASASVAVQQNVSMTFVKAAVDYQDLDNSGTPTVGDLIDYSFTVGNNGNVTLHEIGVTDSNDAVQVTGTVIASLAPGQSDNTSWSGTHEIAQPDIDAGYVDNTAVAAGLETSISSGTVHTVLADLHPHV
jgi:uncharacterized repeat protein (TIGR01451 family)